MRVTLISHASVIIECREVVLWTDPWIVGRAFNESWALRPEPPPELIREWLPRVTHLWVSHEHPDHFHVPTLKSLPDDLKARVEVLFQQLHTDKVSRALHGLGFANVRTVRHRERVDLAEGVRFYLFQEAPLDSACALTEVATGQTVLNINDCKPGGFDRRRMRKDLGEVDLLLNQFSFATYDGRPDVETIAPRHAKKVLDRMILNQRDTGARRTIPFASFMYFCRSDNDYLNSHMNTVQDVAEHFASSGEELVILRPGDSYSLGEPHDNRPALEYYRDLDSGDRSIDPLEAVSAQDVERESERFFDDLTARYPKLLLRMIGRLRFWLPDLKRGYLLDFRRRALEPLPNDDDWDIRVNSQPFYFALKNAFGFQTLSISGRFLIRNHGRQFLLLRVVAALHNSEIYLRPRYLLARPFASFVARNLRSLFVQFFSKLRLIMSFTD